MAELGLRDLERRVASGEPHARLLLQAALVRVGRSPADAWLDTKLSTRFDPQAPTARLLGGQQHFWKAKTARLTAASAQTLHEDLLHLDVESLLDRVPRNRRGALQLGARVLLAKYETELLSARKVVRPAFLVAVNPEKRSHKQVVALELFCFPGDRDKFSWVNERWKWDARITRDVGVELNALKAALQLSPKKLAQRTKCGRDSHAARVAWCLRLQEQREFSAALALFNVTLAGRLADLLAGRPMRYLGAPEEPARQAAVNFLAACAPWSMQDVLERTVQIRGDRLDGKGRHLGIVLTFPKQRQARKTRLVLREGEEGKPELAIEAAGLQTPVIPLDSVTHPPELKDLLAATTNTKGQP